MAWVVPLHSKNHVNLAGDTLISDDVDLEAKEQAFKVINNWRASHSYPLLNFNVNLRNKVKGFRPAPLISQRIKRLESISNKLKRTQTSTLKLAQMQDIAGCRVVVRNMANVDKVVEAYLSSTFLHQLKNHKDYVANPKADGYRGHHLIYAYQSRSADKHHKFDGMRIELQIRTDLQHAWATAVEAVGRFTDQALKSNQGHEDWIRFFTLMSSVCALFEKTSMVPNTPTDPEVLKQEVTILARKLHVVQTLGAFAVTIDHAHKVPKSTYFLLTLDRENRRVLLKTFKENQSKQANDEYLTQERATSSSKNETVLVSVDSIRTLKKAYPNYFLDTERFSKFLTEYLEN